MSREWLKFVSPVPRPNFGTSGWDRYRSPTRQHRAMDFRAEVGTPIFAVGDGVVVQSLDLTGQNAAGRMITVEHVGKLRSRYMHLLRRDVRKGEKVRKGQQIALSGKSGIKRSAPHLHFDLQMPASSLPAYTRVFGRPNGGYTQHANGFFMVPVEQVIPIDTGHEHVFDDAARFGMIMRRDRTKGVGEPLLVSMPAGVTQRKPGMAVAFVGLFALAAAGLFAYTEMRLHERGF